VTVVFLHPIGLDRASWQFLTAERLSAAVRYDMLWHGERDRPSAALTLESFGHDVVESVRGDLDVVGLSFGGAVALTIGLRWPERVRSLLLACSGAGGHREILRKRAEDVERLGMSGVLDVTLRRWFTPAALGSDGHPGVRYARERLLSDSPEAFAASWRALAELDAFDELPSLKVRTTVVHASGDAAGPVGAKTAMVEQMPYARLVVIPGPHMVQLENPDSFGRAVVEHLDWVSEEIERFGRRVTTAPTCRREDGPWPES
jgi:pimeloyl-ACP methyl ester carboxylesterase